MSTHWTLGVLIGIPVLSIIALAILIAIVGFVFVEEIGLAAFAVLVGVVFTALSLVFYYPFKAEYHQWRPVSGKIEATSSRLLTTDSGVEQKIVFRINGAEYGCTDTRCSLAKVGDSIDLSCKLSYQWSSTPGQDCRFYSLKGA